MKLDKQESPGDELLLDKTKEATLHPRGFQSTDHLSLHKVKASVARVIVNGQVEGTGFVLCGGWFLTCNHVLKTFADAAHKDSYAEFDYHAGVGSKSEKIAFDSASGNFITCPKNDWTLVRLARRMPSREIVLDATIQPTTNEVLTIFQHPLGDFLKDDSGGYLGDGMRYEVNTEYGSSGGLVVNSQGQMVAMHQARSLPTDTSVFNRGISVTKLFEEWSLNADCVKVELWAHVSGAKASNTCPSLKSCVEALVAAIKQRISIRNLATFFEPIPWKPASKPSGQVLRVIRVRLAQEETPLDRTDLSKLDEVFGMMLVLSVMDDLLEKWNKDFYHSVISAPTGEPLWALRDGYCLDMKELMRAAPVASKLPLSAFFYKTEVSESNAESGGKAAPQRVLSLAESSKSISSSDVQTEAKMALVHNVSRSMPSRENLDETYRRTIGAMREVAEDLRDPYIEIAENVETKTYKEILKVEPLVSLLFTEGQPGRVFHEDDIEHKFLSIHIALENLKSTATT